MTGRVLVVDDVATNRMLLAARLSANYYDVMTADCGAAALEICRAEGPDLVILDVMMPDIDGFEVCRRLKADPATAHLPVVMVTALNTPEERVRGLTAGADDFLSKPINEIELNARVRNLLRVKMVADELRLRNETTQALGLGPAGGCEAEEDPRGGDVMLVCADPAAAARRARALRERLGVQVRIPADDRRALAEATESPPDAILIDRRLAGGRDGLRLVSALRARRETRGSAILLLAPEGEMEAATKALDLGAADYLFEPFDICELEARLGAQLRRKRYADRLRASVLDGLRLAVTDPLTGLYNRRYASAHLDGMLRRAASGTLGVMMMDLDRFKALNDTWGHAAGDAVLREFGRRLKAHVRGSDLTARLGGEEFLVAMPDADPDSVVHAAERIRDAVAGAEFDIGGRSVPVTVSIGLAMATEDDSAETLIARADAALYESKATGRNRVTTRDAA